MAGDVGGGALQDDAAFFDDHQAVGRRPGVQWIVSDEERDSRELGQVAAELGPRVEAGVGRQGAGEGDALGLAAGEVAGLGDGVVGEAHAGQPLGGHGSGLGLVGPWQRGRGGAVQSGEVGKGQVVLQHDAEGARLAECTGQLGAVQVEMEMAVGEWG